MYRRTGSEHLLQLLVELSGLELSFLVELTDVLPEAIHAFLQADQAGISLLRRTGIAALKEHKYDDDDDARTLI